LGFCRVINSPFPIERNRKNVQYAKYNQSLDKGVQNFNDIEEPSQQIALSLNGKK
jgi:hypothetical protein